MNNIHNKFKLNGISDVSEILSKFLESENDYEKEISAFIVDWKNDSPNIKAKTSGSTGKPKPLLISKKAMMNSAIATGVFFNLQPGNTALLCLPVHYIAGKMMLVRAMVLGLALDCVAPKKALEFNVNKKYNFSAMVPMQLEANRSFLDNILTLIVGGASVSSKLITLVQPLKTKIFETYGMTETVSHIAVKQLNHLKATKNLSFKILPDIAISQDIRKCLVIEAPKLTTTKLITNDVVTILDSNHFIWLGRMDNVINSGGIKIHPEQVEAKLKENIQSRFFITSETNKTLGNAVILIIEGEEKEINTSIFDTLSTFEKPKHIYFVNQFIETTSGKLQRKKTLQLIKK